MSVTYDRSVAFSSTNKSDRHDTADILLKVTLSTINQTNPSMYIVSLYLYWFFFYTQLSFNFGLNWVVCFIRICVFKSLCLCNEDIINNCIFLRRGYRLHIYLSNPVISVHDIILWCYKYRRKTSTRLPSSKQ